VGRFALVFKHVANGGDGGELVLMLGRDASGKPVAPHRQENSSVS
jgi:hypothetical protein